MWGISNDEAQRSRGFINCVSNVIRKGERCLQYYTKVENCEHSWKLFIANKIMMANGVSGFSKWYNNTFSDIGTKLVSYRPGI